MVDNIGQRITDEEHILICGLFAVCHILCHVIGTPSVSVQRLAILHPGDIHSRRTS